MAWLKTLFSAAVYATLIVTFGFQVARVEGQSMVIEGVRLLTKSGGRSGTFRASSRTVPGAL